jgi:WD40 repeat protein
MNDVDERIVQELELIDVRTDRLDKVRRVVARRTRRRRLLAASGALIVTSLIAVAMPRVFDGSEMDRPVRSASPEPPARNATVERSDFPPPGMFITSDSIVDGSDVYPLGAEAAGGLMGWLSPVGVLSPGGGAVAYNSWTWLREVDPGESFSSQGIATGDELGVPSIRMVDLEKGTDTLVAEGAFSVAWRSDGVMAWFEGENASYRANESYLGRIVVAAPDGETAIWTKVPGRYLVLGWAGDSLIAYLQLEGGGQDLLAFSGPNEAHVLAPESELIAISPDGEEVFASSISSPTVSLIEVASRETLATLDLTIAADPSTGAPVDRLAYAGSWVGSTVAAESASGITIFDVSQDGISVRRVLVLPGRRLVAHEPSITEGGLVTAWSPVPGEQTYGVLKCSAPEGMCQLSTSESSFLSRVS